MGLFKGQFANVVEWEEYRDDIIFWKWTNREIKKGSKPVSYTHLDVYKRQHQEHGKFCYVYC